MHSQSQAYHASISHEINDQATARELKSHLKTLMTQADKHMHSNQKRYRKDYNAIVHVTPTVAPGDIVLVKWLSKFSTATNSACVKCNATCNKLHYRAIKPLRVIFVQSHNLTIDKKCTSNMIFIVWATSSLEVPSAMIPQRQPTKDTPSMQRSSKILDDNTSTLRDKVSEQKTNRSFLAKSDNSHSCFLGKHRSESIDQKYTVDQIVRRQANGNMMRFGRRWYEYGAREGTVDLSKNILAHFITRYWRQETRNQTSKTYEFNSEKIIFLHSEPNNAPLETLLDLIFNRLMGNPYFAPVLYYTERKATWFYQSQKR